MTSRTITETWREAGPTAAFILHTVSRRMSGLSKVIVFDPDLRASRQVQLGFEREGIPTSVVTPIPIDATKMMLPDEDAGLIVVGGTDGRALDLLRRARKLLDDGNIDVPILFAGRGIRRTDAETAGADEVVLQPAYLRDVVTIGRLLRSHVGRPRDPVAGNLAETTGVFTLVRALATLGRSAVLTLIRGLRRGEVRFFHGEVTSAQVGVIHGQAALHQLMLWTDARFEFHHEDVVRRHQIPLAHDELFADAERFLTGIRESSGRLSPSMVLEQDVARIHSHGKQVPTEVHGVLRMFDGHRVLADVLEDSPYRVFETLRVAQRALDVGLLRIAATPRGKKATWRAVLALEEWLVGNETREDVSERTSADSSGSIEATNKRRRRRGKAREHAGSVAAVGKTEIDWGTLVPRTVGAEVGSLAGVVPAAHASGEISMPSPPTREAPRERLEALMDTGKRERIFPTDVGLEPSVVWEDREDTRARETEAAEALARIETERATQTEQAAQAEQAEQVRMGELTARQEQARRETEERYRIESMRPVPDAKVKAEADEMARRVAEARRTKAAEAEPRKQASPAVNDRAQAQRTELETEAKALADRAREAKAERDRQATESGPSAAPTASKGPRRDSKKNRAARRAEQRQSQRNIAIPVNAIDRVQQIAKQDPACAQIITAPVVIAESPTATVLLAEQMTVSTTEHTARVVAVPLATVLPSSSGIPEAGEVETSDGVIRDNLSTAETPPAPRYVAPGEEPPDDRPEDATGEIDSAVTHPHLKLPLKAPASSEPSILVADIAAVHSQAVAQAAAPRTPDATSTALENEVAAVRKDASVAFSDVEEDFFRAGQDERKPDAADSFDDLDEGYRPVGFWDRLLGRKR
ncbi:MAG: DUF4388 domain-containing protein [Kofleriaceae bacterium]